ncbi:hypothetical protein E1181_29450 [Saccharopolyspora terrae]|uniref:Uncharacterized protein n=1 Tax=Saccharopolyspora terrae TaxID=2530384 RepID=A0A4V2Y9D5_9PSEU|nr:hypothetical protein [Saccharopolyspora terrae]TDC99465.1 hypothetical protein E1181_29450 [Saccharopolyspora terrae]
MRDDVGSLVAEPRKCETYDNVGQPYGIHASISYEHDLPNNAVSRLHAFNPSVNTAAAVKRGERT